MKKVIHKYQFPLGAYQVKHSMPANSIVTHVSTQICNSTGVDLVTMWACHYQNAAPMVEREFVLIPTGMEFEAAGMVYLGTVQQGSLVWHVHELLDMK